MRKKIAEGLFSVVGCYGDLDEKLLVRCVAIEIRSHRRVRVCDDKGATGYNRKQVAVVTL